MAEYFPTSFTTIQPSAGVMALGDNGTGPVNIDMSLVTTNYAIVASIAALMAYTSLALPSTTVYVQGYYTAGDGGGSVFSVGAATTANGGTIFNDASGRSWYRESAKNGVTVLQFGADPTGETDSTAACQAALNFSTYVYFPPGIYKISAALTSMFSGQKIFGAGFYGYAGAGEGGTTINQTSTTSNIFTLSNESCQLSDFQLNYTGTATAGAAIYVSGSNTVLERFWVQGGSTGIFFTTNTTQFASKFQIFGTSFSGVVCQNIADVTLSDFLINAQSTANNTNGGIYFDGNVQAVRVSNADILSGNYSLNSQYNGTLGVGTAPSFCLFTNVFFDSSANGAIIDQCEGFIFTNCWFSNRPGNGAVVGTTATNGISFIGCIFANCGEYGCLVQEYAVDTSFLGCYFVGNSTDSPGTYSGLIFGANCSSFSVIGCTASSSGLGLTSTQLYGIEVSAGTSNDYILQGNNVNGNGVAGILDGGTGITKQITGNIGYHPTNSTNTITVDASPFTYTNTTGAPQVITVTGGTVSEIELLGNALYTTTNQSFVLPQGSSTTVTYSAMPNMFYGFLV